MRKGEWQPSVGNGKEESGDGFFEAAEGDEKDEEGEKGGMDRARPGRVDGDCQSEALAAGDEEDVEQDLIGKIHIGLD